MHFFLHYTVDIIEDSFSRILASHPDVEPEPNVEPELLIDMVYPGLFNTHLCHSLINYLSDPLWKYLQNTFTPKP